MSASGAVAGSRDDGSRRGAHVPFDDVAGIDEAENQQHQLIDFLKQLAT